MIRYLLPAFVVLVSVSLPVRSQRPHIDQKLWKKALEIHRHAIVVDTHCDVSTRMLEDKKFDFGKRNTTGHLDLVRMKEGGLDAEFISVYVPNDLDDKHPAREAHKIIRVVKTAIGRCPKLAGMATTAGDIRRLKKEGRRAILLGMENGSPVEESLDTLRAFYDLGIRYITLTHWRNNPICDASTDVSEKWHGLSPFGRKLIPEMNRLGIMVDVSHISEKSAFQAIELSTKPVIASHSCARALCDIPRNMSDSLMRAVAKNGGVVMVNFYPAFLDRGVHDSLEVRRKKIKENEEALKEKYRNDPDSLKIMTKKIVPEANLVLPPVSRLIDHIDHMVNVMGIDHVGLGSDFDGINLVPVGLEDVSKLPIITYELLQRGYTESDIRKILGENFLRVLEANELRTSPRGAQNP